MASRTSRSDGAAFDPLLTGGHVHHALHEHPGQVHAVRVEVSGLDELLHLRDRDATGHGAERVEVARALVEDEVAVAVTDESVHETEVGGDGLLEHIVTA